MEHEVEDGPVSVVKIVNPCLYWIRCPSCFSTLEIQETILQSSGLAKATRIERGERLMVSIFDGRLYRAVVQGTASTNRTKKTKELAHYRVFLIDTLEIFVVEEKQLFRVNNRMIMDDLVQQLHLVGIEFGRSVGNLESGFYEHLDKDALLESQKKEIFRKLKEVDGIEFQLKRKYENVLHGKMKLLMGEKEKSYNLLRFLIDKRLAQYDENSTSVLVMPEWMDKALEEQKAIQNQLFPLPLEVKPKEVESRILPPPPPVFFNQEQVLHLKNITKDLGLTNILDKIVPNPEMESFTQMNKRLRPICSNLPPICREQKFEYTSDGSSLASVGLKVKNNEDRCIYPQTSSGGSFSSQYPVSSISANDSDPNDVSSSESELPIMDNLEKNPMVANNVRETQQLKYPKNGVLTSEVKRSSKNHLENKEKFSFGRGMMFQMYLPSSKHQTAESVDANEVLTAGQFDDADSEATPKSTYHVCNFIPTDDDSVIGFLDESSDSQVYYEDVIRVKKKGNVVPSPGGSHPVRSSSKASLPQLSPVPPGDILTAELSGEEPISSVSSSSFSSRGVNLPNLLLINKTKGKREQNLSDSKSDSDNTDISSHCHRLSTKENMNGWDSNQRKLDIIGRSKLLGELRNPHKICHVPSPSGSNKASESSDDAASKELMMDSAKIPPKVGLQSSGPVKGFGRGYLFKNPELLQNPRGLTPLPSQRSVLMSVKSKHTGDQPVVSDESTLQRSEIEKTEPNLNQCSAKMGSKSVSSRQDKLEEQLKKMSILADLNDSYDGSSETERDGLSQSQTKPLLSELVDEIKEQGPTSTSDDEEESKISERSPPNLSHPFLDKEDRAFKISSGIFHGATGILPAKYLSNLDIEEHILKNAKIHKVDFLTRPQYYGIPAILKMKNVVFVSPNQSKKSSAFVIPLLSLLMNEKYYFTLRKGNGPRCVFVAPNSDRVNKLGRLCSKFVGARLVSIATYGGGLELERKHELTAGCDILITTPKCWLRLLQYPCVTNMSRLCHLVLDRFDVLSDLFTPELKKISRKIIEISQVRANKGASSSMPVQIILSSEQWSPAVEDVITGICDKPVLVITSYLEAIVYSRIIPKITLIKSDATLSKLVELVDAHSSKKVVVVCVTPEEVNEVRKACSAKYISILAHENMARSSITEVNPEWNNSKIPPLLICSDRVIYDLGITDAQVLIHFTLPANKTLFSDRFVVLRDHLPDRLLNPKVAPPNCMVHIMIDEASEAPFPCIVNYLRRMSVKIPDKAYKVVKDIERKKEEGKTTAAFCENILQMGFCYKVPSCSSRHVVLPVQDAPKNGLMSYGLIKVQIVHVHSAVKYSARIVAHNPNVNGTGTWTRFKSVFPTIAMELALFYASPGNRRLHACPKEGDLVAYQEDLARPFFRARVLRITQRNKLQEATEVLVFLMDEGIEVHAETHSLIELPEDLKQYPDQTVNIYLANLKPVDLDTTWSYAAKKVVDKIIHSSETEDMADRDNVGKILFTFGCTYVVENLRWYVISKYNPSFCLNLRHTLLDSGCAIDNPEYSSNLADLCASANMICGLHHSSDEKTSIPDEKFVLESEREEPPQWAHFPSDDEYIRVNSIIDESPSVFYVKIAGYHQKLVELESDLSAYMNKNKERKSYPQVGDICAAEYPQDSTSEPNWNRCMITEISGEQAGILFVDYGDRKQVRLVDLYSIPWKYVIKLPFQTIECKLAGILPCGTSNQWSEDAIIGFHNLIEKTEWSEFYVKVMDLDLKSTRTGGRCYHVVLLDVDGDSPIVINRQMVQMGYGYVTSLDIDEAKLYDMQQQIKACASKIDADDESDFDDEIKEGYWDSTIAEDITSPSSSDLPFEDDGKPELYEINWDNVDKEEILNFLHSIDPVRAAIIEHAMGPKTPLLPVTAGSAEADDILRPVAPNGGSQGDDNQLMDHHNRNLEVCDKNVPTSHLDDLDRPQLVHCAPFKTPLIYWRQDDFTITINYMIPFLLKYRIDVSPFSVTFSAIVDHQSGSESYWKRINLFGPVQETSTSEVLSITCLKLKVFKRLQGYKWLRLAHNYSRDQSIKVDPEYDTSKNSKEWKTLEERVDDACNAVLSGRTWQKKTIDVPKSVEAPSSDDEEEEEDDHIFHDEYDEEVDPFDPLA